MIVRRRKWGLVMALSFLVAGCAGTQAATSPGPGGPASSDMSMPGMTMAPGMTMPGMSSPGSDEPAASTVMVCGPQIQTALTTILGLSTPPPTTTSWTDHLYTCTYQLPAGRLVLSVKESPDTASAQGYFDALRARLGPTVPLTGLAGLGQPGYETPTGTVVILKDNTTLQTDATALTGTIGQHGQSPADLAYEVTSDILACWTAH